MSRSRSLLCVCLSLVARMVTMVFDLVAAPVRRIWPKAFPVSAFLLRSLGVRPVSREDAKPAARRVAAYQVRLADRLDLSRVAVSGLFLAA